MNLKHFSMRMSGTFEADRDETLEILLRSDDEFRVIVNGDTLARGWNAERHLHTLRFDTEKGRSYDIVLEYAQHEEDALLNFDIVRSRERTVEEVVAPAANAETVIFVGGISPEFEREEAPVSARALSTATAHLSNFPKRSAFCCVLSTMPVSALYSSTAAVARWG